MPADRGKPDAEPRRPWWQWVADWFTGRTAAVREFEAELDRRQRELRERNARGCRRYPPDPSDTAVR